MKNREKTRKCRQKALERSVIVSGDGEERKMVDRLVLLVFSGQNSEKIV